MVTRVIGPLAVQEKFLHSLGHFGCVLEQRPIVEHKVRKLNICAWKIHNIQDAISDVHIWL
jgi:hypothetical protein